MSMNEIPWMALKKNNYEADATGGTLWTSTTTYDAVVPTGKRWFLVGGNVNRDNAATSTAKLYDAADKVIMSLSFWASATGDSPFPEDVNTGTLALPIVMDAGEYVRVTLSVAQSTAAYGSCLVYEVDV